MKLSKKISHSAKKAKNYSFQMLNQFIPVVLGVYIGIVASNWNAERVRKEEQKVFVNNLYLELQSNKSKMEEIMLYRKEIYSTAKSVRENLDPEILTAKFWSVGHWTLIPNWEGLKTPTLESSVYQTGIMTNALYGMDFKDISSIASIYNKQDDYRIWVDKLIIDNITQLSIDIKTWEALVKIEAWHDIIAKEEELINQYEDTIENLQNLNYK